MSAQTSILYLYDLPKTVTSTQIAESIKNITGYSFPPNDKPTFNRDPNKSFYSCVVKISNESKERFEEIVKKMKYFHIEDKPCRALPYDPAFLGSNRVQYNKTHTVFIAYNDKSQKFYS